MLNIEKIIWKNQDFFLCLRPKVSAYHSLKLWDINRKFFWLLQKIFSCLGFKIIDVRKFRIMNLSTVWFLKIQILQNMKRTIKTHLPI